jgi:uncharacterized membrane protein YiaA
VYFEALFLGVGLWSADLLPSGKVFYGIACFICLFGLVSVQKNVRDIKPNGVNQRNIKMQEVIEES